MFALNTGEKGRILSVTFEEFAAPGYPIVSNLPEAVENVRNAEELIENTQDADISNYRYVDGAYVFDPLPVPEPIEQEDLQKRVTELEEALELLLSGVTE